MSQSTAGIDMSSSRSQIPPPATLGIIVLCSTIYAIQVLFGIDLQLFTMCPRLIVFLHEYFRMITSTLFHANLMHIGMNMLSMSAIGTIVEKRIGTLRLIFSIWWAILLSSTLYILIALISSFGFGYDAWMYQHAVGFSGIIFHLSVLQSHLYPESSTRNLFGIVTVSPALYPWILLIVLQFIMPNLSFLGHLTGILTGNMQYYGLLDKFCLMNASFLLELETQPFMTWLLSMHGFVPTTQGTTGQYSRSESSNISHFHLRGMIQSLQRIIHKVLKFVRNICETILVCIFGRGYRLSADLRFGENSSTFHHNEDQDNIDLSRRVQHEEYNGDNNADAAQEHESLVSRIV